MKLKYLYESEDNFKEWEAAQIQYAEFKKQIKPKEGSRNLVDLEKVLGTNAYGCKVFVNESSANDIKQFVNKWGAIGKMLGCGVEGMAFLTKNNKYVIKCVWVDAEFNLYPHSKLIGKNLPGLVKIFDIIFYKPIGDDDNLKDDSIGGLVVMEKLEQVNEDSYVNKIRNTYNTKPSIQEINKIWEDIDKFKKGNYNFTSKLFMIINNEPNKNKYFKQIIDISQSPGVEGGFENPKQNIYALFPKEIGFSPERNMWVMFDLVT